MIIWLDQNYRFQVQFPLKSDILSLKLILCTTSLDYTTQMFEIEKKRKYDVQEKFLVSMSNFLKFCNSFICVFSCLDMIATFL